MGGQAQSQQPVFYDAELGQYYTQAPQNQSPFAGLFSGVPNGGQLNGLGVFSSLFGKGGERTYLNSFNQRPQVEKAPYQYADTSLESLFPSQGGGNSALSSLLGSSVPSATGSASSGAGRFM